MNEIVQSLPRNPKCFRRCSDGEPKRLIDKLGDDFIVTATDFPMKMRPVGINSRKD